MTIQDGYTFSYKDWHCRPLAEFGKVIAREHYQKNDWDSLDAFLWTAPHFIGDETTLKDNDKTALFSLMVDTPMEYMERNLRESVKLELTNPLLAKRSCNSCKKWWFDSDTNLISMRDDSTPILRPETSVLPCDTHEGCPKGHHTNPIQFNRINRLVWKHYLEWSRVGLNDNDKLCPVLRRNWRIIGTLVDAHGLPEICYRIL